MRNMDATTDLRPAVSVASENPASLTYKAPSTNTPRMPNFLDHGICRGQS